MLSLAQERARSRRHGHIGTEHLLLALLDEGDGPGSVILCDLAGGRSVVERRITARLPAGQHRRRGAIPYTDEAKPAIQNTAALAREVGADVIGTDHVLAGIAQTATGPAAEILHELGLTPDRVRAALTDHPPAL